ncbi:MAG TPA: cytidylate kinase family protein [Candidatus Nanoarchaeia archaeon]|nr:cytidylate kinase family protein [Candidatus Nanoarchaeia archaeon]
MIITLSGTPGSGKSSVAKALAKKLGCKFYKAGELRRKYASQHGLTLAELNKQAEKDPASDKLVDDYMKKMAKSEDNLIVDAVLGFHFFPNSIKIFLDADAKMRAKRIFERENFEERPINIKEAFMLIEKRQTGDAARFEKLYGVNHLDPNHFDLTLDTTNNTVEQTVSLIYRFIMSRMKG